MKSIEELRRCNLRRVIREKFGDNRAKFAQFMDWSERSLVSRLLSEKEGTRQNIGSKMARSIEARLGLPPNQLDAPEFGQPSAIYNVQHGAEDLARVPLVSWSQACTWGEIATNFEPDSHANWVAATARVGPRAFAVAVLGDSMVSSAGGPSFPEGTVIIVDPDVTPEPGQFVIAKLSPESACVFKQLVEDAGRRYLRPLNPQYPMLELGAAAELRGVAVQSVINLT